MSRLVSRSLAVALACVMAMTTILPTAAAAATAEQNAGRTSGMIATQSVIAADQAAEQRARVNAFMQRDDVRNQLQAMGVSPDEAERRIDGLSDQEVASIADKIGDDPAGQGIGWVVGVAILIAAILFITDVIGVTNIYPFVNP